MSADAFPKEVKRLIHHNGERSPKQWRPFSPRKGPRPLSYCRLLAVVESVDRVRKSFYGKSRRICLVQRLPRRWVDSSRDLAVGRLSRPTPGQINDNLPTWRQARRQAYRFPAKPSFTSLSVGYTSRFVRLLSRLGSPPRTPVGENP